MKTVRTLALAVWLGLFFWQGLATAQSHELLFRSSDLAAMLRELVPPGSIKPPFRIEVWVQPVYGLQAEGVKTRLKDCLREQLHALGDVEFVDFLSKLPTASTLRMRVWFTKLEKPDPYDCFDTTIAVVIGRIVPEQPMTEVVLDSFAVAGIADGNLFSLCQSIVERLDLQVLSVLRRMTSQSGGQ
jgi:hypothetical protein